jgi:cytochrome c553
MQKIFWIVLVLSFLAFCGAVQSQEKKASTEYSFVGTKNCKKCHIKQFKSWKETKMAKAFEVLKPGERAEAKKKAGLDPAKDYTTDAECLACHTTGYGKPGGFVSLEKTPQLVGVSCETCHGAGGEYTKKQYMSFKNKNYKLAELVKVGLVSPVTAETCISCHNEKSPFYKKDEPFDFEKNKTKDTHENFPLKYKHE